MKIELNECQKKALKEIIAARDGSRKRHTLTGYAGTGKTTLMQAVVEHFNGRSVPIVVTAPTHKAVSVLSKKLEHAGLCDTDCMTIHSLLGLKPAPDGEKTALKRSGPSKARSFQVVVIDECSMISSDLYDYIENDLDSHFVLFVGDPAQLPPVGESESLCFGVRSRSNLATIVRQAAGNPILRAAQMIRDKQDLKPTWEWTAPAEAPPVGVYKAGDDADEWMKDAFTSDEFAQDNDAFRYLAWTNARVADVNSRVRRWIYGCETPTPFVAGERVICRTPILLPSGRPAFATNEEATVKDISADKHTFHFEAKKAETGGLELEAWSFDLDVWRVLLESYPQDVTCIIARFPRQFDGMLQRLKDEALKNRRRWYDRFQAMEQVTRLQAVYVMTVHTSQGSTFQNVFVDLPDIRKCELVRPKEMQQMLYVAVTRASHAVVLVGS